MATLQAIREGARLDGIYIRKRVVVPDEVLLQEVDVEALLVAAGRDATVGPARYLTIATDDTVYMRINSATADEITITTSGYTLPLNVMNVSKLYFRGTGLS